MEWTLSVLKVDNQTTEYTNHIRATATANSLPSPRSMESHLNRLQRPQIASDAPNEEETPNFAARIERHALTQA